MMAYWFVRPLDDDFCLFFPVVSFPRGALLHVPDLVSPYSWFNWFSGGLAEGIVFLSVVELERSGDEFHATTSSWRAK